MNKNIKDLIFNTLDEDINMNMAKEIENETEEINNSISGAFHSNKVKSKPNITVCVDFDGTIVIHKYPEIGDPVPGAIETLKYWIETYNVGIILDTMRSGSLLGEAVKYCEDNGITLYGVGKDPTQHKWTDSNKAYAPYSIDDRNVGCPLCYNGKDRPYVDWEKIKVIFEPILTVFNRK